MHAPLLTAALLILICAPSASAQVVKKRPLGSHVNTPTHRELLPVVSPDGSTLWFVREGKDTTLGEGFQAQANDALRDLEAQLDKLPPAEREKMQKMLAETRAQSAKQGPVGVEKQTVWISQRGADGQWGPATRVAGPLNDPVSPSGVVTALPDGNTVLAGKFDAMRMFDAFRDVANGPAANTANPLEMLTRTPANASLPVPDLTRDDRNTVIGLSRRTADGWSALELLRIVGYAHQSGVRSDYYLSPNGRTLLLSLVNSESMHGSRDLFVSQLQKDGRWSKPKALAALSSPDEDISPWIAPDTQTVYFSSNRSGGAGDNDIWMARRLDDTWQKWSAPVNLGPTINTPQADMNLAVDATGNYAFMSIGERGKEDIYEFELPAAMRPTPVAFVRGKVTDPAGKPLPASILYEVLRTAETSGSAASALPGGRYQIALPIGEHYGFRASATGYLAISDAIDLRTVKAQQVLERDLVLVPMSTRTAIRLNNVFFHTGKATLLPESRAELDRLVGWLKSEVAVRIELRGHTDNVDDDAFNKTLSEERAAAVVAYLVNAGVPATRLAAAGFGETQPVAPNDSEQGRAQNRRVEFVIAR